MSETIISHPLHNPNHTAPMEREAFYKEQIAQVKRTGQPSKSISTVAVFLFNLRGELIVQKRDFQKQQNAGLLDKSVGGHIRYGDTPDFTVMVETIQELQSPSIVLANHDDFVKTRKLLKDYLSTVAIIQRIREEEFRFARLINDQAVTLAYDTHLYFGIYDGRVRTADKESKGALYYTLDELKNEMQKSPNTFTGDLQSLLPRLEPELHDFLQLALPKS